MFDSAVIEDTVVSRIRATGAEDRACRTSPFLFLRRRSRGDGQDPRTTTGRTATTKFVCAEPSVALIVLWIDEWGHDLVTVIRVAGRSFR